METQQQGSQSEAAGGRPHIQDCQCDDAVWRGREGTADEEGGRLMDTIFYVC